MVAYSFKKSFVPFILDGSKRQTIRNPRKRHAQQGEVIQLYSGMRTKHCQLIGRAHCASVHNVELDFGANEICIDDAVTMTGGALDAFALSDGFQGRPAAGNRPVLTPWEHMRAWWRITHDVAVFRGMLIRWGDLLDRKASA